MVSPRESIDAYSMRGWPATTGELFRRVRHVYRWTSIVRGPSAATATHTSLSGRLSSSCRSPPWRPTGLRYGAAGADANKPPNGGRRREIARTVRCRISGIKMSP